MEPFLLEWEKISSQATTNEEKEFFMKVKELAKRCQSEIIKALFTGSSR